MAQESKAIGKADESALILLNEILGDSAKSIPKIDSYYNVGGKYYFVEFIKCDVDPFDYDPNCTWAQLKDRISTVWEFVSKAEGKLCLALYDQKRTQFKLLVVAGVTDTEIAFAKESRYNLAEFQSWFQGLNNAVLNQK